MRTWTRCGMWWQRQSKLFSAERAIQTILRREGYPNPYETLKALTRKNTAVTQESIAEFIAGLDVPQSVKEELLQITPHNYTGY